MECIDENEPDYQREEIIMIELSVLASAILAAAIPALSIGLSPLTRLLPARFRNIICSPPQLLPLRGSGLAGLPLDSHLKREIWKRLSLAYFLIALFFLSNTLGTFYQILADQAMWLIDPGFTPRVLTGIGFSSPFSGGWFGSFEWYGQMFLPPEGSEVFHETWNWIFFSAGMTDDSTFFVGATRSVLIFTILFGLVFLVPLSKKSIRQSFFQSLILLSSGMSIVTRGVFGLFAQAFRLEFGQEFLRYGAIVVTGGQLQVTTEVALILALAPVILGLYGLFLIAAKWLWSAHYPGEVSTINWFGVFVTIQYWMSLLVIML